MRRFVLWCLLSTISAGCSNEDPSNLPGQGGRAGRAGGESNAGTAGAHPGGTGGISPSDAGDDAPPLLGSTITQVVLRPEKGNTEAGPVTFAQAFRQGDVADTVVALINDKPIQTQVDVKRRHPDGSIRHAVITVQAPTLPADRGTRVELRSRETVGDSTFPTLEQLLSGGFDATVEVEENNELFSVSIKDLWVAESDRWLTGPIANEFRVMGGLEGGGGVHPALALAVDVRFYSSDSARVSIAIENVYDDTPGDRTYNIRILGADGSTWFEQSDVEHFHHARWRHVASWGVAAPAIDVVHDLDYLIDVGAVPRYDTTRTVPQATVDSLVAAWDSSNRAPLGNGLITEYFPTTGGRDDIGPLPKWAAVALMTGNSDALEVMYGVGTLAGSFSIHYRDRDTGRALSIDEHPTVSLIASSAQYSDPEDQLAKCTNCTSPYNVDLAHQPSLAFVPYLLTGDPYYLDELYFWTSYNFISQNWDDRGKDEGRLVRLQVRAQAWAIRTLAHTAWISPDGDPERTMLEDKLHNNFAWYAAHAVGSNPFGWWGKQSNVGSDGGRPDENMASDVRYYTSPWMSDFLVWTFDYCNGLGYTDAAPIRDWLARFTVGRFTNDPDYNRFDGSAYHIAVSSVSGDHYATWAELWDKSFAGRTDPPPTELPWASCSLCYPIVARVALTGAIHGETPHAQAAYDFVTTQIEPYREEFSINPTWAIVP